MNTKRVIVLCIVAFALGDAEAVARGNIMLKRKNKEINYLRQCLNEQMYPNTHRKSIEIIEVTKYEVG